VNPSWVVTKLMLAQGRRPRRPWMSAEPENREAKTGRRPSSPFQNLRTVSRYWSFHSAQPGGKLPTWYPPAPGSQGSAISLTADSVHCLSTGRTSLGLSWKQPIAMG